MLQLPAGDSVDEAVWGSGLSACPPTQFPGGPVLRVTKSLPQVGLAPFCVYLLPGRQGGWLISPPTAAVGKEAPGHKQGRFLRGSQAG